MYISLPSLLDYDVKLLNFTFYGGRGHKTIFFPFVNFVTVYRNSTPKKAPKFDQIKRVEIKATKFEAARIHFSGDVFAAVAV